MALAAAFLLVLFTSPVWAPPTLLVSFGLGLLWPRRIAVVVSAGLSAVVIVAILNTPRPVGTEGSFFVLTVLLGAFLPACALVSAAGYGVARIVRRHASGHATDRGRQG